MRTTEIRNEEDEEEEDEEEVRRPALMTLVPARSSSGDALSSCPGKYVSRNRANSSLSSDPMTLMRRRRANLERPSISASCNIEYNLSNAPGVSRIALHPSLSDADGKSKTCAAGNRAGSGTKRTW